MLACNLIQPPFERLAQFEILAVQCQDVVVLNRIKHPVRQRDFNIKHSAIAGFLHNLGRVDQAEYLEVFLAALAQIGFNLCALQTAQGGLQELIAAPGGLPVRRHQQVIGLEASYMSLMTQVPA